MTASRAALIISLCIALVALHIAGLRLEFYWRIGWYDRLVHILAGAVVALAVFSLSAMRRFAKQPLALFLGTLLVSLAIGVLWEVFELRAGITYFSDHGYMMDTMWDIICDAAGGLIAGGYLFFIG